MAKEELDDRKAKLYGAMSGLGLAETTAQGLPQAGLGVLSELGEKAFDLESHGFPLWIEDNPTWQNAVKIREHIGAPRVPIYAGPEDFAISPNLVKLRERFPFLFEAGEEIKPLISVKSRNGYAGLAHELGHTVPSPIADLSILSHIPLLRLLSAGAGAGLAVSDNETAQSIAPAVSVAPYIPGILEEGRATMHGVRGINAVKGPAEAAKALARLSPAFMTYLLAALPALAAPYVAKGIKEYVKKKKKSQEKNAAEEPKATGRAKLTAPRVWTTPAPKPKTSKPGEPEIAKASPPAKGKFYGDMMRMLRGGGERNLVA